MPAWCARRTCSPPWRRASPPLRCVSILWVVVGYSLAFTGDGPCARHARSACFCTAWQWTAVSPLAKTIPEALFMIYQMTFAVITVALVAGSVADRMRFSAFLLFAALWLMVVYVPIAHWVWGGGFLPAPACSISPAAPWCTSMRALPALSAALVLGKRHGYGIENLAPYDLSMAVIGTGLLVGRLVRLQWRLGARRQCARRRWRSSRRIWRPAPGALTWMALEWCDPRQAVRARHDLGRGRRARHHHAGLRLRAAVARPRHRRRRRRDLLLGLHRSSSRRSATTTRSTCSASTASAA